MTFLNLFDFSANLIVLVNQQARRVTPLLKFISLIEKAGFCESCLPIGGSLDQNKARDIEDRIKNEITRICEKKLASPEIGNTPLSS